jgi:SAM-dependent methyltransferase
MADIAATGSAGTGSDPDIVYRPEVFREATVDGAKRIILTPEAGKSTDERWAEETAWLVKQVRFPAGGLLVDFGCGIGRLARELPQHPILGVDISPEMRRHAQDYVDRAEFQVLSPDLFRIAVRSGLQFDGGYALWVLQHVLDPLPEIALLARGLRRGAPFWLLNQFRRCVPTNRGWMDDGKDVRAMMGNWFTLVADIALPATIFAEGAYLHCYQAK